jgi:SOUL heme-binding protein
MEPAASAETLSAPGAIATPRWRNLALWASLAAPIALGVLLGRRSRRAGLAAGLGSAAALGALRWQLGRWFTAQPRYQIERRIGPIEVRRYPPRIEASTRIDTPDLARALRRGVERLLAYVHGGNQRGETFPRVAPFTTEGERLATTAPLTGPPRDGAFTMSFALPARLLSELPRPRDARVELHEHGSRRIAVLCFHGRSTRGDIARAARALLALCGEAGLSARGPVAFASYDGPSTLPWLRRNEVWVDIAEPH